MPLNWVEDTESRSATIYRLGRRDPSTRQRVFNVFGTDDEDALHADANARISSVYAYWTYPGQPQVKMRAEFYSVDYRGDRSWRVAINYEKIGADNPADTGPSRRARSFDTTGTTQKLSYAIVTVDANNNITDTGERRFGPGGENTVASMNGAINVDDNGINGVDVPSQALQWTETYDVPSKFVTNDYVALLSDMTPSVNNALFRGFAAGSVMFLGAQGAGEWDEQRGNGPFTLTFRFKADRNRTDIAVGSIKNVAKYGQQYLWVRYASQEDNANQQLVKTPIAVYVNNIARWGDFSRLGIGTA